MQNRTRQLLFIFSLILTTQLVTAQALKGDNEHARTWNAFADKALELHNKLIKKKQVEVKSRLGGYAGTPDFYKEEQFIDKATGKLISLVQWERENPTLMHTIEVYVRDDKGRVTRDYVAAYLPTYRNAPTQTLVSFHAYNGNLHGFRSFDASGYRVVERCTGSLNGQEVNMLLDEDEIVDALHGNTNVMQQADYKACFKGLPEKPGKYLTPQ